MPKLFACALVALVLVSLNAHAARHNRILLIVPESEEARAEVLSYWNDGVGMEVDMVVDPALGTATDGANAGMLATFDTPVPGAEWVILRVSEPGELAARLDGFDPGQARIAAMGPFEAFADNPRASYARLEAVILITEALPNDGDRAAFLSRARVVATQANEAMPGMLIGVTLAPAVGEDDPLMPANKLFADTRDFVGVFAVDVAAAGPEGIPLVDTIANAPTPGARGMYMDMMQRPENVLDPGKEVWMQRGVMALGVLTILGVFLIVRFKRPPSTSPPTTN